MYRILVTYGTVKGSVYARGIRTREDAETLRRCALELHYHDARIEEYRDEEEEDGPRRTGTPRPSRPHRRGRRVHDVRGKSRTPAPGPAA